MSADLVRGLMERAARAIPARVLEIHDGDWWRVAESDEGWWAGSALLHGDGDLGPRIGAAEEFFTAHGATARFQVCPACTDGLDAELGGRGYRRLSDVSLQVAATADVADHAPARQVRVESEATWARATILRDETAMATGRAAADDGWVGVFDMVTRPEARRRGAGRAVLAALAAWARDNGCDRTYLQVTLDNTAALGLYAGAGFRELARYHYRVAPRG